MSQLKRYNGTSWENVGGAIEPNLDVYSTTEIRVGTWIDNKPIYRKVISTGSITLSTTMVEVATGISNISKVVNLDITLRFSDNNWFKNWHIHELLYKPSNQKIGITLNSGSATFPEGYIIIEYTKTTD